MRMLRRLAEIGVARAELLHAQSQDEANLRGAEAAAAPDADAADRAKPDRRKPELPNTDLALHRIARMVRQCMLLSLKFYKERLEREKQVAADHAVVERSRKERRKQQIERVVKQAIDREAAEREKQCEDADEEDDVDLYGLQRALSERLDEDDIERDLDRCPRGELIARICRELGIEPAWDLWRQHDWALEEAHLKPPGSPYAGLPAAAEAPEAKPPPAEARPDEPKAEEAKPEEPAAPPIRSNMDRLRYPTPDEQRAEEERKARIRARYPLGSG